MQTKLSQLKERVAAGDWNGAIAIAARFPRLGAERAAILDARLAATNPSFCRGIKKDPDALIEAGKAAILAKYY